MIGIIHTIIAIKEIIVFNFNYVNKRSLKGLIGRNFQFFFLRVSYLLFILGFFFIVGDFRKMVAKQNNNNSNDNDKNINKFLSLC